MNGQINGSSINGDSSPGWVLSGEVSCSISALSVTADPSKKTFGSINTIVGVSASIQGQKRTQAAAAGGISSLSSISPNLVVSGGAVGVITAVCLARASMLYVGSASGDISVSSLVSPGNSYGQVSGSVSVTASIDATVIKFGRCSENVSVDSSPISSDVFRYGAVSEIVSVMRMAVEPAIKFNGESFFNYDGSSVEPVSVSCSIDDAGISIKSTHGMETHISVSASASGQVIKFAKSNAIVLSGSISASATVIKQGSVAETIQLSGSVSPIRTTHSQASGGISVVASAMGGMDQAASAEGSVLADMILADATKTIHAAVSEQVRVNNALCKAHTIFFGNAEGTITAINGRAYAVANSEVPAPDERIMVLAKDGRKMDVQKDSRKMVA